MNYSTNILFVCLFCIALLGGQEGASDVKPSDTNMIPDYIVVTESGRDKYLVQQGTSAVIEKMGDNVCILVNGLRVITVKDDYFTEYTTSGVPIHTAKIYKSLSEQGGQKLLNQITGGIKIDKAANGMLYCVVDSTMYAVREPGFIYICPVHPKIFDSRAGVCPLCGCGLKNSTMPDRLKLPELEKRP